MARPKSIAGNDMREQIIIAASQLITERGVEHTSLKDIAQAAGISTGTLFYHFASKSALIFDITDRHFDQLTHQLLDWVASTHDQMPPAEIIGVVLQTIVGDQMRGRLHHYLIQEAIQSDAQTRQRFKEKYRQWRQLLEDGLSQLDVPVASRSVLAEVLLSILDGLVLQAMLGIEDIPLEPIASYLAEHC